MDDHRVLLLFPPMNPDITHPELGIAQLAAYLRARGVPTEAVDCNASLMARHLRDGTRLEGLIDAMGEEGHRELFTTFMAMASTIDKLFDYFCSPRGGLMDPNDAQVATRHFLDHMEGVLPLPPPVTTAPPLEVEPRSARALVIRSLMEDSPYTWAFWNRFLDLVHRHVVAPPVMDGPGLDAAACAPLPILDEHLDAVRAAHVTPATRLVGISVHSSGQLVFGLKLARAIRQAHPGIHLTLGGVWCAAAADILPGERWLFDYFDSIVLGEGERPLFELVQALDRDEPVAIPGVLTASGSADQPSHLDADPCLDTLPLPAFDHVTFDDYVEAKLPFRTFRGCYWGRCLFCYHILDGAREDAAPPCQEGAAGSSEIVESLVRFVEQVRTEHRGVALTLADNATPMRVLRRFAESLVDRGIRIPWECMARFEPSFTRERCQLLRRSGCEKIAFGLETSSQGELDRLDKGIRVDTAREVLAACTDAGIRASVFLLDYPSQPLEVYEASLAFACDHHAIIDSIIPLRFELSRTSPVFRHPELLDLTIPPQADEHLDVFSLPFEAEGWHDYHTFKRTTAKYMVKFLRAKARRRTRPR